MRLALFLLFSLMANVGLSAGTGLTNDIAATTNFWYIAGIGDSIMRGDCSPLSAASNYNSSIQLGGSAPTGNTNMNVLSDFFNLCGARGTNIGYSGVQLYTIATNNIYWATNARAKYVFLHCLINDIANGRSWTDCLADLNTIRSNCVACGSQLIVDECFPYTLLSDVNSAKIRTYNTNMYQWAATNGVWYFADHDYMGTVRASTGFYDNLNTNYAASASAGLHLWEPGVSAWASNMVVNFNAWLTSSTVTATSPVLSGKVSVSGKVLIR